MSVATTVAPDLEQIERWLLDEIALRTGDRPTLAFRNATFEELGLDSAGSVEIAGALAKRLGQEISEALLFECPTIGDLLGHLAAPTAPNPPAIRATSTAGLPTAIRGIALRLPGAKSLDELWALAASGQEAIGEPPPGRFDLNADIDREVLRGSYLTAVNEFDSLLFAISPRDAANMDPQHRILLELGWEVTERAGVPLEELRSARTGVFIGISSHDFAMHACLEPHQPDRFTALGIATSMAANRISHALGLTGPSLTVDTACSSGLVALHLAHRHLQWGDCDFALVGAVNLILRPETSISLARSGILSAKGHCLPFERRADGFVRGEGAGMVLLGLEDHLANDPMLALVRGTAVNSNGRTNGILAPSITAQRTLLEDAYAQAGVPASSVSYIEARATGSPLADIVEAKALAAVLGIERPLDRICTIGSIKGNLGHLEAASGIAGLANVLACAGHEQLLPIRDFQKPLPAIAFDELPIAVAPSPLPWPGGGASRFAGLSASGLGGTNAHLVLELP